MEQFEKVKTDMDKLDKNDKIYDSLEEISDLAAGVNLKSDLQELFNRYLKYVDKKCLLICIDDLDLNISEGYKMAEMLRKYLICPQCMILVAVKVGQLIEVIATAHRKEIKDADISWERCLNMAQKYVAKLLPRRNRISMPIPTDFCEYNLEIEVTDNSKTKEDDEIKEKEPKFTVKEKVVQMIFQKTGYVFYNTQYLSPIIPKNLRSLRHLLGMLFEVPDAKDENGKDNEMGRDTFKDYFFGTWAAQLPDKDYTFAQQLAQYDDLTTLNSFVVEYFAKRVKEHAEIEIKDVNNSPNYEKLYLDITSKTNTAANISFGDVMYILWLINGISLNVEIQNLIFLIKTVYSMRLYACYKTIARSNDKLYPPTPKIDQEVHIHRAETLYEHVNQLQRLINGSYFTYPQGALLPLVANKKTGFRDRVIVRIEDIKSVFDDLKNRPDDFLDKLRLCEYLALCICRTTISREHPLDLGSNRIEKIPTYIGKLSSTAQYVVFDFLQPFYSLCNIKYTYERFDNIVGTFDDDKKTFYKLALETKDSLLNQLLTMYDKADEWKQMHSLIADAIIRVVDAQWAIYDELIRTRKIHKNGDESIFAAYDDIRNLKIKLYPLIRKDINELKPVILSFKFLNVLSLNVSLNNLGEILYTSKEEKQIEEILQLLEDVRVKLRPLTWPIKGKVVRQIISDASPLKGPQKSIFTKKLKKILKDDNSWYTDIDEVMAKEDDLGKLYIEAKTPKKNVKKNTKKPIKK